MRKFVKSAMVHSLAGMPCACALSLMPNLDSGNFVNLSEQNRCQSSEIRGLYFELQHCTCEGRIFFCLWLRCRVRVNGVYICAYAV